MLLMKLIFLLLIIVCAVFYILYVWDFSFVLLVVVIAVPVVMFAGLLSVKLMTKIQFCLKSKTVSKNESFDIQLYVSNKSFFPVGKAEAVIEYYNIFNNSISSIELHFPIQPRNSQRVTFQLSSKFCGMVKVSCAYVTIYDPLRIFKFRIGKNICESIVVLPECHDINGFVSSSDRVNEESKVFSEHRPGDDPSEVFDLRDYRAGDRLNRIHWKISSKKENLIVKEYSCPVDSPVAVFIDLLCREESELALPMYDTLLELAMSVSQLFIENESVHNVIYYSCSEKDFVTRTVNNIDTLASVMKELITSLDDNLFAENPEKYFTDHSEKGWASFNYVTARCDAGILESINDELDADVKNVFTVVKSASEASAIRESFSSINIIPVAAGKISSSVRDIEL